MKIKVIPILLLLPFFAFSQTAEEKRKLASFSNKEANAVLAKELQKEEQQRKLRLDAYLKSNPQISKVEITDDGFGKKELMDVLPNGEKIYAQTHNAGSAITARANSLYSGGSLGINIQGQGMTAGVWDGGQVRDTHQEFVVNGVSKVSPMDGYSFSNHATHVAGTIAAQGIVSSAKGLAFNSQIESYDWDQDLTEIQFAASGGLLMSNHSYGIGSLGSIWFYGAYDTRARSFDQITHANPFYLPVVSAGNSRNDNTPPASTQIGLKGGYDMVFGHANAKNVLTVAAVNQVNSYVDNSSVQMSNFSSWGPSDDGRIKPDISMKGVGVYSTLSTGDSQYGPMQGTSMASPGITGVVVLLQQYYNQLYSNFMRAATVKGLILHTADEAGAYPGPDYEFGWGLVNTNAGAVAIRDKNLSNNRSIIEELVLNNGVPYTKTITASGTAPLRVSISWTDPASNVVNSGTNDPSTKYIINDLDVKVTSNSGQVYFPWKGGGMAAPWNAFTNDSTNDVDNFERIDIPNPSGTYTITVSHKGALVNNMQNYSLIVTSNNLATLNTIDINKEDKEIRIFPNPVITEIHLTNVPKRGKVSIVDSTGRIVMVKDVEDGRMDVAALEAGVYYMIYVGSEVEFSGKFLKK